MVKRWITSCVLLTCFAASAAYACKCGLFGARWSYLPALSMALDQYASQHGAYPVDAAGKTWEQQLIDNQCLYLIQPDKVRITYAVLDYDQQTGRVLDRWGSPFVLTPMSGGGAPTLRSNGPDGVDDGGLGDDLRCEQRVIFCNDGHHWKSAWPAARFRTTILAIGVGLFYVPALVYCRPLRRGAVSTTIIVLGGCYLSVHGLWFPRGTYIRAGAAVNSYVWFVLILVGFLNFLRWRYRVIRARNRIAASLCPTCAYPIDGLPGSRCPECGIVSTPVPS